MSDLTVQWLPRPTDAEFELAAPLLQRVVDTAVKGEFTVDDLRRMARAGSVLIGLALHGDEVRMAAAIELVRYPSLTAVNVMALAGSGLLEVAERFFDELKAFARACGADRIEACAGSDMARVLQRRLGFSSLYEKVGCDL